MCIYLMYIIRTVALGQFDIPLIDNVIKQIFLNIDYVFNIDTHIDIT